jgi:hypothetical protein
MLSLLSNKKRAQSHVGVSITATSVSIAMFHKKSFSIVGNSVCPLQPGVLSANGDELLNPSALAEAIIQAVKQLPMAFRSAVHVSVPCTLLKLTDAPKVLPKQLAMVLASEAEQYKAFDNTDALIDFAVLPAVAENDGPYQSPANTQRVIFGALRKDALEGYVRAFQLAKIKISTIDLEPLSSLRAMAGTGVLGSLMQQIGTDSIWGSLFVEPDRIRLMLWKADCLLDLREVLMVTTDQKSDILVSDLLEEISRSTKLYKPVIWLTHGLLDSVSTPLSEALQLPFFHAVAGPNLGGALTDVSLATLGASLSSEVGFPFGFDLYSSSQGRLSISANHKSNPSNDKVASGKVVSGPGYNSNSGLATWLPNVGIATCIIMGLLWGGLTLYGTMLGNQASQLDSKREQLDSELLALNQQVALAQAKYKVQTELLDLAKNARIRNIVYQKLAEDLKFKTPNQMWLNNIEVGETVTIEGKALHHESVLALAKSFDNAPYVSAVLIDSIKEALLSNQPVFDFKIGGQVNKNPALIEAIPPTATALPNDEAKPTTLNKKETAMGHRLPKNQVATVIGSSN